MDFHNRSPVDKPPAIDRGRNQVLYCRGYRATTEQRPNGTLTMLSPPNAKAGSPRALFVGQGFYGAANSQAAAEAILQVMPEKLAGRQPAFKAIDAGRKNGARQPRLMSTSAYDRSNYRTCSLGRKKKRRTQENRFGQYDARTRKNVPRRCTDLGLDALDVVSGRVRFAPGEPLEWQIEAGVHAPGPYRGIVRLFGLEPGPMPEIPAWVRGDVVSLAAWRWDFVQAMKGFGTVYDESNEPGPDGEGMFEDMLDALRDDPEGVHVDLRRDVFDQLSPEMLRVTAAGPPVAADEPPALHTLFVAPLGDAGQVRDTFARFYKDDAKVRRRTAR